MPLDPDTLLWTTPQPNANPGPGGPGSWVGGALGVMNAFRAKSLSDEADARRKQAELEEISKQAAGGGANLWESPEGQGVAGALGVSPETTSAIFEGSPNRRIRAGMATLKEKYPDQQIPSHELETLYLSEGQPVPPGLYGYLGRQQTASTGEERIQAQLVEKALGPAVAALKASISAGEDQATQQQRFELAFGPALAMLNDANRQKVQNAFDKTRSEMTGKAAPVPTARAEELKARAGAETARGSYLAKMAEVASARQATNQQMVDLRKNILKLQENILRAKAEGKLTAGEKLRARQLLLAYEKGVQQQANLKSFGFTPNPEVLKDYMGAIGELHDLLKDSPDQGGGEDFGLGATPGSEGYETGDEGGVAAGVATTGVLDGTIIQSDDGKKKLILRGGQWQTYSGK